MAWGQVLEGYIFLGNISELGARLSNAFTSSVSSTVRQVPLIFSLLAVSPPSHFIAY